MRNFFYFDDYVITSFFKKFYLIFNLLKNNEFFEIFEKILTDLKPVLIIKKD